MGLEYISQAIDQDEIYIIVKNAMEESAVVLSSAYGVQLENIMEHISDLLYRFTNAALKDTCKRVGGDPGRKLAPGDRLIGPAALAFTQGVIPAYIAVGAAAGIRRYIDETEGMEQTFACAQDVLKNISKLEPHSGLRSEAHV